MRDADHSMPKAVGGETQRYAVPSSGSASRVPAECRARMCRSRFTALGLREVQLHPCTAPHLHRVAPWLRGDPLSSHVAFRRSACSRSSRFPSLTVVCIASAEIMSLFASRSPRRPLLSALAIDLCWRYVWHVLPARNL